MNPIRSIENAKESYIQRRVKLYKGSVIRRYPDKLYPWEKPFAPLIRSRIFGTVANLISVIRLLLAVIIFLIVHYAIVWPITKFRLANTAWIILTLITFIFAGLLDLIDGPVARCFDEVTRFGKMLDPFADKMLLFSALLDPGRAYLPPAIFWAVLAQEGILILFAGAKLAARKLPFTMAEDANKWGKWKNLLEQIGAGFLFLCPFWNEAAFYSSLFLGLSIPLAAGSIRGYIMSIKTPDGHVLVPRPILGPTFFAGRLISRALALATRTAINGFTHPKPKLQGV